MSASLGVAFARQARADFELFQFLRQHGRPACHWLHALQMACEKTAKAYLAAAGMPLDEIKQSHLVLAKYLGKLLISPARKILPGGWQASGQYYWKNIRPIADALERLVPGRHNAGRNAEYPWVGPSGDARAPIADEFSDVITALNTVHGRTLLKLVEVSLYDGKFAASLGLELPS